MLITSLTLSLILSSNAILLQQNTAVDMQKLRECARVENDLQRLVCYDALLNEPKEQIAKIPKSNFGLRKTPSQINTPNKPDMTQKSQTSDEPSAMQNILNTFLKKSENINTVTYEVLSHKKASNGAYIFTMKDGSIWHQTNAIRLTLKESAFTVTISKGNFDNYILKPKKGGWTLRVKRIK